MQESNFSGSVPNVGTSTSLSKTQREKRPIQIVSELPSLSNNLPNNTNTNNNFDNIKNYYKKNAALEPGKDEKKSNTKSSKEHISNKDDEYTHPFWFVCSHLPSSYWDYDRLEIDYNTNIEPYDLIQKIGRGKYSEVFCAINRNNACMCVCKILKPVRLRKIKREISILRNLCGGPNVVRLLDVLRDDESSGTPILVTEFIPNAVTLRSLMLNNKLTNFDLRFYLYEVLRTLDFAHRRGIFHRDIKPHNIMINHERRLVRVIDWGLAEYYIHGEPLNCGVATRHYKAPELLVGYRHYDFSLDIWCTGCVLAGMLFKSDPFFVGDSNEDQLVQIVSVFGTNELYKYVNKYKGVIPRKVASTIHSLKPHKTNWTKFIHYNTISGENGKDSRRMSATTTTTFTNINNNNPASVTASSPISSSKNKKLPVNNTNSNPVDMAHNINVSSSSHPLANHHQGNVEYDNNYNNNDNNNVNSNEEQNYYIAREQTEKETWEQGSANVSNTLVNGSITGTNYLPTSQSGMNVNNGLDFIHDFNMIHTADSAIGDNWCDETALDLLDKMLQFDHAKRITAYDAMMHPFFAPVRAVLSRTVQEQYPSIGNKSIPSDNNNNNNNNNNVPIHVTK